MKCLLTILLIIFCTVSLAQKKIETEINAENVFELSIISVYPEDYPNVSVIFQAKNNAGKPLWLLKKSELVITENGDVCEIIRLINITKKKPINIGLVFDHSSSMFYNPVANEDSMLLASEYYFNGMPVPSWYTMAIDYAKEGILEFMSNMERSDSVLFVGFSNEVDKISALSSDLKGVEPFLKSVSPDGSTAFYDALYLALDSLSAHDSGSAVVALTDGQDNSSKHSYQEVIDRANASNIPIYIIGLGDVDKDRLMDICKLTNGFFYQTNNPEKLGEIYSNIKAQLKSIYQVDYLSLSDDFTDNDRSIKFSFLNDTLTFSNATTKFSLPEEALLYLEKKENERLKKIESDQQEALNQKLLWGGIGVGILLLGIGSFLVVRRKKIKLELEKIYPNPFNDVVTVTYVVSETILNPELKIVDLRGNEVTSHAISNLNTEITIDTTNLRRGVFIFTIRGGGKNSEGIKGVKQ